MPISRRVQDKPLIWQCAKGITETSKTSGPIVGGALMVDFEQRAVVFNRGIIRGVGTPRLTKHKVKEE